MADPRLDQIFSLYNQLDELITAEEMETYPFLAHLEDFLEDLELLEQD